MSEPKLMPCIDLTDAIEDREVIAFTLGPTEEVIVLAGSRSDAAVASGRDARRPYNALLIAVDGEDVTRRKLTGLKAAFPLVQPLPDGETLVVASRAVRTEEGHDLNASVYDVDGLPVREFLLGDGIEDVQTTEDGSIWVSYFDEGVYGNYGWGNPDGPPPIGASGLARFDRLGAIKWEFEPPIGGEEIDDCYALNVVEGVVWAYYYASFTLARIEADTVNGWKTPVGGARALTVRDDTVSLVGGYRDDAMRCVVCRFAEGELVEQHRFRLATTSGALSVAARIAARGENVYALDGTMIFRVSEADV